MEAPGSHTTSHPGRAASPRPRPWPDDGRLIVIGASAGGVEALQRLVRHLPPSIHAAIVVVLHIPATASSRLPEILGRVGVLPARHAVDGEHLDPGVIYVAPPDRHLVVGDHHLSLADGPRENGVRPAIDPLMRSAARSFGERTIGVVLSGTLDDGTAGLAAIHSHGGVTIAQEPSDAICPGMPMSAIETGQVDHVVSAEGIADLLADLVSRQRLRPSAEETAAVPSSIATDLICPECGGALRQFDENGVARFHCRVGHNYSPESLYAAQDNHLEAALWAAVRALEESASMARRLAVAAHARRAFQTARRFESREREAAERADVIRSAILTLSQLDDLPSIAEAQPVAAEDDARRPRPEDFDPSEDDNHEVAPRSLAARRSAEPSGNGTARPSSRSRGGGQAPD
jgi:two-component system chemotaxis response regulator CheB